MRDVSSVIGANIVGGPLAPKIKGEVFFRSVKRGTIVCVQVIGLPTYRPPTHSSSPVGPHGAVLKRKFQHGPFISFLVFLGLKTKRITKK